MNTVQTEYFIEAKKTNSSTVCLSLVHWSWYTDCISHEAQQWWLFNREAKQGDCISISFSSGMLWLKNTSVTSESYLIKYQTLLMWKLIFKKLKLNCESLVSYSQTVGPQSWGILIHTNCCLAKSTGVKSTSVKSTFPCLQTGLLKQFFFFLPFLFQTASLQMPLKLTLLHCAYHNKTLNSYLVSWNHTIFFRKRHSKALLGPVRENF